MEAGWVDKGRGEEMEDKGGRGEREREREIGDGGCECLSIRRRFKGGRRNKNSALAGPVGRKRKGEARLQGEPRVNPPRGHAAIIGGVFTISIVSLSMNVIVV